VPGNLNAGIVIEENRKEEGKKERQQLGAVTCDL